MKKRIISGLLLLTCLLCLPSCGKKTGDVSVDYGKSQLYSVEDMDAAIRVIKKEFSAWKGCELHSIRYDSDECNAPENIEWMNEFAEGQDLAPEFTQCIMFLSNFHSPVKDNDGAWEEDTEYKDWQWYLARTEGGDWQLMTWGYG